MENIFGHDVKLIISVRNYHQIIKCILTDTHQLVYNVHCCQQWYLEGTDTWQYGEGVCQEHGTVDQASIN
jgi:hypothetical protein